MLLNLTLNVEITQARKDKESARALPVLSHFHYSQASRFSIGKRANAPSIHTMSMICTHISSYLYKG